MGWKETMAQGRTRLRLNNPAHDRYGNVGYERKKNARKPSTTPPFMSRMLDKDRSKASLNAQNQNAKPPLIEIHPRLKDIQIALLHEFGHSIDWHLGKNPFVAEFNGPNTPRTHKLAIRIVRELMDTDTGQAIASLDYYSQPKEVFARRFAQYVITKNADRGLLTKIDETHRIPRNQWRTDEFAPVVPLYDALFGRVTTWPTRI
jgi:hypothetical protein